MSLLVSLLFTRPINTAHLMRQHLPGVLPQRKHGNLSMTRLCVWAVYFTAFSPRHMIIDCNKLVTHHLERGRAITPPPPYT